VAERTVQLLRLQEDLAHVARISTMGELTASIAHEVSQPLAAVSTNADACRRWLMRKEPNLEEARDALERIIRESSRASDVVRRIRALSRKTTPQRTRLQLNDIVHEVLTLAQSKLLNQQISLTVDMSATLPEVLGDRVQLQQVLLNLIVNAIDAVQPVVGRPRELGIRTSSPIIREVQLIVRDSGVGLDSLVQTRLFEPFFTTKPEGMGLGLSISRRIVEAHGGQLRATPNFDHGTTLVVILPSAASDRTG
jgi:C4-dicarboxylate-specific signal transduction histidine kinase